MIAVLQWVFDNSIFYISGQILKRGLSKAAQVFGQRFYFCRAEKILVKAKQNVISQYFEPALFD